MSKGGGQTQTIQKADPWTGVQPYIRDLLARGQSQLNTGSPYLSMAVNQQAQTAMNPNSLVAQGQRELGRTISGDYLSIDNNPAIQSAINAARRTVSSQFSGDNFGSSAHQEWLARGAAEAAAPLLAQERQNQLAAINAAPGLQQANTQQLYEAGLEPWRNLQRYQGIVGTGMGTGGTTTTSEPYSTNPLAGAIGGGLAGYGVMNMLGSSSMLPLAATPWGIGIGALAGLLGSKR